MKHLLLSFVFILFSLCSFSQNTGIGVGTTTPNPSAAFEIADTSKGILIPRMTMNQRLAIQNPAEGLMVYQYDNIKGFWFWDGTIWKSVKNSDSKNITKNNRIGFSESTLWTCPPGLYMITVELWGAGGTTAPGVCCAYGCAPPNSGGRGGYNKAYINVTPDSTYQVTVGVIGAGPAVYSPFPRAPNGGYSYFSNLISAMGGFGGIYPTCIGYTAAYVGYVGGDGDVINYDYNNSKPPLLPNYISSLYLTNAELPRCCAPADTNGFVVISY
jgi:hypothetical protein